MKKRHLIIIAAALLPLPAWARPVSYPGGWTVMQMHDRANTSVHLHYSPSAKYSVGLRGFHARSRDAFVTAVQVNFLLKRLNTRNFQANLYLKSAAGIAVDDDKTSPAGFTGISADWESRRILVRYENRFQTLGDMGDSFTQSWRAGIAPYLADFGSLHTWLILDAAHYPGSGYDKKLEITPLARFLKGASLFEIGYSFEGKLTLNFIRRF